MTLHPLAGQLAPHQSLVNIPRLISDYYLLKPQVNTYPEHKVSFGTSGHRGSSFSVTFNEDHLLAIIQAICDHRESAGISGPVILGMDTHALSEPAFCSAVEVFIANGVKLIVQKDRGYTPTPVISHAILQHNLAYPDTLADGLVLTPSHNPPEDGGIKYNGVNGGPADIKVTGQIQNRANELLGNDLAGVKQVPFSEAIVSPLIISKNLALDYVDDLGDVIDFAAISAAKIKIGIDPLGGSGTYYWSLIAEKYHLDIELVDDRIDPTFSFMTVDNDGKIRMDCSSPYSMQRLIGCKEQFDIAIGNDPDYDRHGIVTKKGLLSSGHYLAAAIHYLFTHRKQWPTNIKVGKTLVSSSLIDRVVEGLDREVVEMPVGFKWFVQGLSDGTLGFIGDESAGGCFLKKDGGVWTTDKDGIIMGLLAAEILAVTGKDPEELYQQLTQTYGTPIYRRIDVPANWEQKVALKSLNKSSVTAKTLAGEPILAIHSHASGNNQSIGGLKVVSQNGWFAARPSGTEPIYKIYLESFLNEAHMVELEREARLIVDGVLNNRL
ncbi:MAG: phosphoglucomutase [Alteromonadaceae bacterium]|jgi:phosphoglucomutase